MTKTEVRYIAQVLRALKPDAATAPVIQTTEWRRVALGLAHHFSHSTFRHLFDNDAWIVEAGADTPEPEPREGEPFERGGVWYNLTESEGGSRGLVFVTESGGWIPPRNLDPDGRPIVDPVSRQALDATTGEWRDFTPAEAALYPAPESVPVPDDAAEGQRSGGTHAERYCLVDSPSTAHVCTRPPGHDGLHWAVRDDGVRYCEPWPQARPAPRPPRVATCGEAYADEDGEVLATCERRRGHMGDCQGTGEDGEDYEW